MASTTTGVNAQEAMSYRGKGWAVVPACWTDQEGRCMARGKNHGVNCDKPGKTPIVRWKQYQSSIPSESETRKWWATWPEANIFLITGAVSGVLALDVDRETGGFDSLA